MQTQNLWGKIDTQMKLPDPVKLLQRQAALIEDLTGGTLVGRVRRRVTYSDANGMFRITLGIIAPYLENYTFEVVDATYPPTIYPVVLVNAMTRDEYVCKTEDEFVKNLGEVLRSEKVQDYISALIAHSHREREYDDSRRALIS